MSLMELMQSWELGLTRIPDPWMFNSCCFTDVLTDQAAAETSKYASNYIIKLELAKHRFELKLELNKNSN